MISAVILVISSSGDLQYYQVTFPALPHFLDSLEIEIQEIVCCYREAIKNLLNQINAAFGNQLAPLFFRVQNQFSFCLDDKAL